MVQEHTKMAGGSVLKTPTNKRISGKLGGFSEIKQYLEKLDG